MNVKFSSVANGMVWCTIPIMAGLFYWEYSLRLTGSGHTLAQIVIVLIVCGWAYIWNRESEYDRLRHLVGGHSTPTNVMAHMITGFDSDIRNASRNTVEASHYVSNN